MLQISPNEIKSGTSCTRSISLFKRLTFCLRIKFRVCVIRAVWRIYNLRCFIMAELALAYLALLGKLLMAPTLAATKKNKGQCCDLYWGVPSCPSSSDDVENGHKIFTYSIFTGRILCEPLNFDAPLGFRDRVSEPFLSLVLCLE